MRRLLMRAVLAAGVTAALPAVSFAQVVQEKVDLGVVQQIRDEGLNRSQLDSLIWYMTEVIGPRLTNSPANRRANDWAASKFQAWGLANAHVEPWDSAFGRGWERLNVQARVMEPFAMVLTADVQAWSGGTKGTVTCPVVLLEVTDSTDLAKYEGRAKGACFMRGAPSEGAPEFMERTRRSTLDQLLAPPPTPGQGGPQGNPEALARFRAAQATNAAVARWIRRQGPVAILQPSGWNYDILLTGGHPDGRTARDSVYEPTSVLVVGKEQYGRMYRNAKNGAALKLELNVQTRFFDGDRRGANVLAEIPGTDKRDEIVMLGAHYDSWHSGTGATDNAAGSAAMMEAIRILKTLNLPMRRTVRIGLWSGEEQGLLGSRAWVRMHAAELPKISAYVNLDNGTGKVRGIWDQMNQAAIPVFEQILFPFRDLGVVAVRHGNTGGTDHLSFDAVGVPGFNFIQDPIEYGFRTHHSNLDVYDALVIPDLQQAATVIAWTVYHIANRDDMMPRKQPARP